MNVCLNVQLHSMLSGDDASKEQVEKQVLNIWDRIYKTWFAKVLCRFCLTSEILSVVSLGVSWLGAGPLT